MKKLLVVMSTVLLMLGVGTSRSFASAPDAQTADIEVNENGTDIEGFNLTGGLNANTVVSASVFTTGLGTITTTYAPGAAGNYYIDTLVDEEVGTAFFNEYVQGGGSPLVPGGPETAEAGFINADTWLNYPTPPTLPGQIYTDEASTTGDGLTDGNNAIGGTSNFSDTCAGSTCNGDAAIALGADFSLDATSYETVTVTISDVAPSSGFYIEQINPQDVLPNGSTQESEVYFSETAVSTEVCTVNCVVTSPIPEPSPWILLATGLLGAGMIQLRRKYSFEGNR